MDLGGDHQRQDARGKTQAETPWGDRACASGDAHGHASGRHLPQLLQEVSLRLMNSRSHQPPDLLYLQRQMECAFYENLGE